VYTVVRPRRKGEPGKDWKIFDEDTGELLAECATRENALLFRRIRDSEERRKQRGKICRKDIG
jgi:hypothetical protein